MKAAAAGRKRSRKRRKKGNDDVRVLRDLAKRYAEAAAQPIQDERRELWRRQNSLKRTRPLILVSFGMWNVWCREMFGDGACKCRDPFFRDHERNLRILLFHDWLGDDWILEPWITQNAAVVTHPDGIWGVKEDCTSPGVEGGAWKYDPPLKEWADTRKLTPPHHVIDEEATNRHAQRLQDAVGDILEVNVDRGPLWQSFHADIAYHLGRLRGLEQLMVDMIESPGPLKSLLAFMRDGVMQTQEEGERAGDWSLTSQSNQAMCYCESLEAPRANSGARTRKDLWCFCAAQEYTLVSPQMHDEFLLRYQIPIIEQFGLVAYGCCEDLTQKISILRKIPNLRRIAVAPSANVPKCAEQIQQDYVLSLRPNPTDMVSAGFDEERIKRIIRRDLEVCRDCYADITLKDVETVEGAPDRLKKWVWIVRDIADRHA